MGGQTLASRLPAWKHCDAKWTQAIPQANELCTGTVALVHNSQISFKIL